MRTNIFAVLLLSLFFVASSVSAATIDSTNKYARFLDSNYGTINFNPTNGNVTVTDSSLTGYAFGDGVGWIHLAPTNGGVVNDGSGVLSGYAWGENTGWINFKPTNGGVTINSSGDFLGYAWSQNYGWIVFNCATDSTCGTFDHKVSTDWTATASAQCNNGIDDDGDGQIDYPADSGCSSLLDNTEESLGSTPPPPPPTPNPTDVCPNIAGAQSSIPAGYIYDGFGNCILPETSADVCPNIAGEQTSVPSGRVVDGFGNCIIPEDETDLCPNIVGKQASLPEGYVRNAEGYCVLPPLSPDDKPPIIPDVKPDVKVPEKIDEVIKVLPTIVGQVVEDVYVATGNTVRDGYDVARKVYATKEGEVATKAITTAGVITGVFMALGSAFLNPASFTELALAPFRLWALLLSFLGLRKKYKPWGTVYDSITKQPLDPAYVILQDENGKEVTSSITDIDGRYGFLSQTGRYKIVANKTNYIFPSKRLQGRSSDELYSNLYFGEIINITDSSSVITKSIPMDPEKFDWNEFAKKNKKLMKFYSRFDFLIAKVSNIFFVVGFVVSVLALFVAPQPYNLITFTLYVVLILLRIIGLKPKPYGYLSEKTTGNPLSYAIVRVMSAEIDTEIAHKISDATGRYFCLVPNGRYYLKIERKKQDESYEHVFTTKVFDVKKGIINIKIQV